MLLRNNSNSFISSNTGQGGNAGTVTVAAGALTLGNRSFIGSATLGGGDAGTVTVAADTLTLDGSFISSGTFEGGDAGSVTVTANTLTLDNQSLIESTTDTSGTGGNIILNVNQLVAANGSGIIASSREEATGNAGNIRIQGRGGLGTAARTVHLTDAAILTSASTADGGNIEIIADEQVQLRNSQITATVGGGQGAGGNITIDTAAVLLLESRVQANAFGGPGGNVTIRAQGFLADAVSPVSASSAQSVEGSVEVQGVTDLSSTITSLPQTFGQTPVLIPQRCAEAIPSRPAQSLCGSWTGGSACYP